MTNKKKTQDYYVIDFLHIFKTLWKKLWIIVLSALVCGVVTFSYAKFFVPEKFSSSIMLYVNNSSFSVGSSSISLSELDASKSLVNTYCVILESRETLTQVINKIDDEYKCTYEELCKMIKAESVNETEVLRITVTTEDYEESKVIANTIADVLPDRISGIIDGASMRIVDTAIANPQKVSPNITRYTEVGILVGAVISIVIIAVLAMLDDTIHDEEYIHKTYDYPILAVVPNLLGSSDKQYAYYYQRKKDVK